MTPPNPPALSPLPRSLSPVLGPLLGAATATALRADIFRVRLTWQDAGIVCNSPDPLGPLVSLPPPPATVTQLGDKQCQTPNPGPWASTRPGTPRIAMPASASLSSTKGSCTGEQPVGPLGTSQSGRCGGGRRQQGAPLAFLSVPPGLCLVLPERHLAKMDGAFPITGTANPGEKIQPKTAPCRGQTLACVYCLCDR